MPTGRLHAGPTLPVGTDPDPGLSQEPQPRFPSPGPICHDSRAGDPAPPANFTGEVASKARAPIGQNRGRGPGRKDATLGATTGMRPPRLTPAAPQPAQAGARRGACQRRLPRWQVAAPGRGPGADGHPRRPRAGPAGGALAALRRWRPRRPWSNGTGRRGARQARGRAGDPAPAQGQAPPGAGGLGFVVSRVPTTNPLL